MSRMTRLEQELARATAMGLTVSLSPGWVVTLAPNYLEVVDPISAPVREASALGRTIGRLTDAWQQRQATGHWPGEERVP